ncbi:HD domain-containing protein [Coriobacteriia bacterium Es71-Z0120]|uniref:HD-GYP domain-containing protein n=1 Tax=Parvivirga hydrogeniphila TaxID=2939460 RepID=UPI0022608F51|nr:HD domain-containing phosphohydrolase [Parvivirga hydrogeniphila]MCL4078228.1 HD domain-containing protein [Parvivirga hydrogeniphila]
MSDENGRMPEEKTGFAEEEAARIDERGPEQGAVREAMGARPADDEPAAPVAEGRQGVPVFSAKQLSRARDVLARLHALRRARQLYPIGHPSVAQAASDLLAVASRYHEEGVDVPLVFYDDQVLLGEQMLLEESMLFDQLTRDLTAIGAGSIVIKRGATLEDVLKLADVIAQDPARIIAEGGAAELARRSGVEGIEIRAVAVQRGSTVAGGPSSARAVYTDALDLIREIDRILRSNQVIDAGHVRSVVRSLVSSVLENRFAMLELASLKRFDEYTFYHSVNVAILSIALGSSITNDVRFLSTLGTGALLHDIGKMMVPLEVLNKTDPLTTEEWALIRHHPIYGAENIMLTPGLDKAAAIMVLEHHARYDLTGYPTLHATAQHVSSRIVAVADAYDAMTSRRSYSAARRRDEAIGILVRNAGSALDPGLVRLFIRMMGVYPPGCVVRLSTGELAAVVAPSVGDARSPRVRIVADEAGVLVDGPEIDLSDPSEAGGREVVHCVDLDDAGVVARRLLQEG